MSRISSQGHSEAHLPPWRINYNNEDDNANNSDSDAHAQVAAAWQDGWVSRTPLETSSLKAL